MITSALVQHMFRTKGTRIEAAGNKELLLWQDDSICWIEQGEVDLFITEVQEDGSAGTTRLPCHSFKTNQLLFSEEHDNPHSGLVVRSLPDTVIWKLSYDDVEENCQHEIHREFGIWVRSLMHSLSPYETQDIDLILETGESKYSIPPSVEMRVSAQYGTLCWIRITSDDSEIKAGGNIPLMHRGYIPVSSYRCTTLKVTTPHDIEPISTEELVDSKGFHEVARNFAYLFSHAAKEKIHIEEINVGHVFYDRQKTEHEVWESNLRNISKLVGSVEDDYFLRYKSNLLVKTCMLLGDHAGFDVVSPSPLELQAHKGDPLNFIAKISGLRIHTVTLKEDWYDYDSPPMLCFKKKSKRPVVLVKKRGQGFMMVSADKKPPKLVTPENADTLDEVGYVFFRAFPERAIEAKELIGYALGSCKRDIAKFFIAGFVAAIIALLNPIVTSKVINTVIPNGYTGFLTQIAVGLLAAAIGTAIFELFKALAVLRGSFAAELWMEPAMWDRVLKLPLPFFRIGNAGDIANRANSLIQVTDQLKGTILITLLSVVFATVNLSVLFYYHYKLALCVILAAIIALLIIFYLAFKQATVAKKLYDIQGKISGMVMQFTTGISKIKTAGAELRAYEKWSTMFLEQKKIDRHSKQFNVLLQVFSKVYHPIVTLVVLMLLLKKWDNALNAGEYAAFNTAMSTFLTSLLSLSIVVQAMTNIYLLAGRSSPILQALPENTLVRDDPGNLSGHLEVASISFRYRQDMPLVLSNVSIRVRPGEFIAIAGGSGSGKSTLMRLILGFETPEKGGIFYDGVDITGLDTDRVRQQMGVVLQHGGLLAGSILNNITGAAVGLTLEDAEKAARLSGFDMDVKAMPMGMYTHVPENAFSLSGGQRQKLMLARALVGKPAMLLLDEATSALDNDSQEVVLKHIEQLNISRIVIAHRLSTIVHADRIYVLDKGELVQEGTYEELMAQDGLFKQLAERQLA